MFGAFKKSNLLSRPSKSQIIFRGLQKVNYTIQDFKKLRLYILYLKLRPSISNYDTYSRLYYHKNKISGLQKVKLGCSLFPIPSIPPVPSIPQSSHVRKKCNLGDEDTYCLPQTDMTTLRN